MKRNRYGILLVGLGVAMIFCAVQLNVVFFRDTPLRPLEPPVDVQIFEMLSKASAPKQTSTLTANRQFIINDSYKGQAFHSTKKRLWCRHPSRPFGLNNQRQALMASAWTAYALNRTLMIPRYFEANQHVTRATAVDDLFNLTLLDQWVDWEWWDNLRVGGTGTPHSEGRPAANQATPFHIVAPKSAHTISIESVCEDTTHAMVREQLLPQHQSTSDLVFSMLWIDLQPTLFLEEKDDESNNTFTWQHFLKAFQPKKVYEQCAQHILAYLSTNHSCSHIHGVHMRLGDRDAHPLFNCSQSIGKGRPLFRAESSKDSITCVWDHLDSNETLTMRQVIEADIDQNPREWPTQQHQTITDGNRDQHSCLYVATNVKPKRPRNKELQQALHNRSIPVFFYRNVVPQLPQSQQYCRSLDPSFLEMSLLATIPGRYFPSFPSSWDEYVLQRRALLLRPSCSRTRQQYRLWKEYSRRRLRLMGSPPSNGRCLKS